MQLIRRPITSSFEAVFSVYERSVSAVANL
jgi:hypothetical protein